MRRGVLICGLLTLLSLAAAAFAADPLPAGSGADYARQQQAFLERPDDPATSYAFGQAAYAAGDYEAAAAAFERVLIARPGDPQVKLQLARTCMRLGTHELARRYFLEVLASNPPDTVRQYIRNALLAIDAAQQRSQLGGFLRIGYLYDDNVPAFPDEVLSLGRFWPRRAFAARGDQALNLVAVLNHYQRLGNSRYGWRTSLVTDNTFYDDLTDYDLNYYGLSTGLTHQEGRLSWELLGLASQVDIDYRRYAGMYGAAASVTYAACPVLAVTVGTRLQEKNNYEESDLDATNWSLELRPVLDLGRDRLSLGMAYERENAGSDLYSYRRYLGTLGYQHLFPLDIAIFGSMRYQDTAYEDRDPVFNKRRDESLFGCTIGLSKTFWRSDDGRQSLAAEVSYTRTSVNSNIDLYEYDKSVTMTALTYLF